MTRVYLIAALAAPLALMPLAAAAETCPPAPDHQAGLQALIDAARAAPDAASGQEISQQMWALWAQAPDAQAQALLDRGMSRRAAYDYLGALEALDRLVAYCPDYAEGYNQRAFVNYLRQDFSTALVDLDAALARSPRHIAALSGKALTLMALNRAEEARGVLAAALALNPWIPERGLAAPGGPLAPVGEDI